jgi:uncharacterized protein
MMLIGYICGLAINIPETILTLQTHFEPLFMQWTYYVYDLARIPMTLGHVGLVMLVFKSGAVQRVFRGLAAAGQMALTNYIGQTVICITLFYGIGFGLYGRLTQFELMLVMAAIWLVQVLFSVLWLRNFRFGPLEWLWRSLTYWQRQPLRRAPAA